MLVLKNIRIAYTQQLFRPGTYQNDPNATPKYSGTFIINKKDPQMKKLETEIQAVAKAEWRTNAGNILRQLKGDGRIFIKDGATKLSKEGEIVDGFGPTAYFFNASAYNLPAIVDENKTLLEESDNQIYPGCYVNIVIRIKAQDNKWGKRINAELLTVQFARDGEAFDYSAQAREDALDLLGESQSSEEAFDDDIPF